MPSASLPGSANDPACELRALQAELLRLGARAEAALGMHLPDPRPGETLRVFLAAEEEAAAIARRIRRLQVGDLP